VEHVLEKGPLVADSANTMPKLSLVAVSLAELAHQKAQTDWNRFGGVQNQVNSLNSRVHLDGQFCQENPATMPQKLAENCPPRKTPPSPPILH